MRLKNVAWSLAGGAAIYLAMAACAAVAHEDTPDGSAPASSSGASGTTSSGSLFDHLVDPVTEASAEPGTMPVEVVTEPCDKKFRTPVGQEMSYAEHAFAGASAAELALVVSFFETAPNPNYPPGYTRVLASTFMKDGAVAATCGVVTTSTGAPATPFTTSITFVRRR